MTVYFPQDLFAPLIKELGFEYSEAESVDTRQLRTKIIEQAASAGNEAYVFSFRIVKRS